MDELIARWEARKERAQEYVAELSHMPDHLKMPDELRGKLLQDALADIALIDETINALREKPAPQSS